MKIKKLNTETGRITIEMQDVELRTIVNLFCEASGKLGYKSEEYEIYSNLYTAISILSCGRLPDFELNRIKKLRDKATVKEEQQ